VTPNLARRGTDRVSLRDATPDDCEQIYAWNFAPDVRRVSGQPTTVQLADHRAWYAARLATAASAPMWVVEDDGVAIGVIRIDDIGGNGRMSIALAASARGRGIGQRAISAACTVWARPVIAQIRDDNSRSRTCFEACGFVAHSTDEHLVTYHWRPEEIR
jgi:RimJ/RimL family protein N-acetyltransferase